MKLINININNYFHMIPLWKSPTKLLLWSYPWSYPLRCTRNPFDVFAKQHIRWLEYRLHGWLNRRLPQRDNRIFCLIYFWIFRQKQLRFWVVQCCSLVSWSKAMQNHCEILPKRRLWVQTMRNLPNCPDVVVSKSVHSRPRRHI